jgi:hypothetical protein
MQYFKPEIAGGQKKPSQKTNPRMNPRAHLSFWELSNFVPGLKGRHNLAQGSALGQISQSGQALQGRIKSLRFEPPLPGWPTYWEELPKATLVDSLCLELS